MKLRLLTIAGGIAALLILAGAGGAYTYYFSGARTAPKALSLSPAATPSSSARPSGASALAGTWTVGSGSIARYRVSEQFAGASSPHEAVAQTGSVSGGLTAAADSSGYQLSAVRVTVGLGGLQSQDTVAGFNVSQRDRIVQQSLSTSQYPDAVFVASMVDVPSAIERGQPVNVSIPGQLTVHGATKDVTFTGQAQKTGSGVQVVGSTQIKMTDFGVNPPALPITVVQDQVTLEFQLQLTKS